MEIGRERWIIGSTRGMYDVAEAFWILLNVWGKRKERKREKEKERKQLSYEI